MLQPGAVLFVAWRQRRAFDQVATRFDEQGERYMTVQDFVSAYVPIANPELEAQLLALYKAFSGAKDRIYFSDFALFNVLMARPDPEYDIAFALLDRQKRGYLILDDIREYVKTRRVSCQLHFDCWKRLR